MWVAITKIHITMYVCMVCTFKSIYFLWILFLKID